MFRSAAGPIASRTHDEIAAAFPARPAFRRTGEIVIGQIFPSSRGVEQTLHAHAMNQQRDRKHHRQSRRYVQQHVNHQPPMALGSAQGGTKHPSNLTNDNFTRTRESLAHGLPSQGDRTSAPAPPSRSTCPLATKEKAFDRTSCRPKALVGEACSGGSKISLNHLLSGSGAMTF